jgi:predicted SAM-dependent methyltransferase
MRRLIERIEGRLDPRKRARQILWYLVHRSGIRDRKLAQRYITRSEVRKLHLGCGWNLLPDWLNMDYLPRCRGALYLDARRPFFFRDETFDYVFSEHMIEHMAYHDGLNMLSECHRILKKGGTVRISTPDLSFLIKLCRGDKTSLQREYIAWSNSTFLEDAPEDNEVFVINNFMRNWGHTFIYDESTLRTAMIRTGFTNITRCDLQHSADDVLCNLENIARIPKRFIEIETITLEGIKKN